MQRGILFHHLMSSGSGASRGGSYLEQFVFPVVDGANLDIVAFGRAWEFVIQRRAELRACFDWSNGTSRPFQLIASAADVRLGVEASVLTPPVALWQQQVSVFYVPLTFVRILLTILTRSP